MAEMKEELNDWKQRKLDSDQKLRDACKKIDHFRLFFSEPSVLHKPLASGNIDSTTIKIYCSQNKPFWNAMIENGEADLIGEWRDMHYEIYSTMLELLHAKGLKVEIKQHIIDKRIQAQKQATPEPAKQRVSTTVKSSIPDWAKTPTGKAVYGHMQRTGCSKEQAEKFVSQF